RHTRFSRDWSSDVCSSDLAGDLYDLVKSSEEPVKPVGQWNQVRLVQQDGKIEHWLNGVKVVEADMNSQEWKELVAGSKFNSMPEIGRASCMESVWISHVAE